MVVPLLLLPVPPSNRRLLRWMQQGSACNTLAMTHVYSLTHCGLIFLSVYFALFIMLFLDGSPLQLWWCFLVLEMKNPWCSVMVVYTWHYYSTSSVAFLWKFPLCLCSTVLTSVESRKCYRIHFRAASVSTLCPLQSGQKRARYVHHSSTSCRRICPLLLVSQKSSSPVMVIWWTNQQYSYQPAYLIPSSYGKTNVAFQVR